MKGWLLIGLAAGLVIAGIALLNPQGGNDGAGILVGLGLIVAYITGDLYGPTAQARQRDEAPR